MAAFAAALGKSPPVLPERFPTSGTAVESFVMLQGQALLAVIGQGGDPRDLPLDELAAALMGHERRRWRAVAASWDWGTSQTFRLYQESPPPQHSSSTPAPGCGADSRPPAALPTRHGARSTASHALAPLPPAADSAPRRAAGCRHRRQSLPAQSMAQPQSFPAAPVSPAPCPGGRWVVEASKSSEFLEATDYTCTYRG